MERHLSHPDDMPNQINYENQGTLALPGLITYRW